MILSVVPKHVFIYYVAMQNLWSSGVCIVFICQADWHVVINYKVEHKTHSAIVLHRKLGSGLD